MLDVIVLIAMAVTAAAFAAGLIVHSGIALIPSVIAGAALYLVMAASYLMISRQTKATPVTTRLQELEEALEIIDSDLQRIDRVEDDVARLDLLTDRVERLDQTVSTIGTGDLGAGASRDCRARRRLRAGSCADRGHAHRPRGRGAEPAGQDGRRLARARRPDQAALTRAVGDGRRRQGSIGDGSIGDRSRTDGVLARAS